MQYATSIGAYLRGNQIAQMASQNPFNAPHAILFTRVGCQLPDMRPHL